MTETITAVKKKRKKQFDLLKFIIVMFSSKPCRKKAEKESVFKHLKIIVPEDKTTKN